MANMKACVRGARKDGIMSVYIRVTHNRSVGYIKTDKMVGSKGVGKKGEIKDPFVLGFCSQLIMDYSRRLNEVDTSTWTAKRVVEYLHCGSEQLCFSDYARRQIDKMIDDGKVGTAKRYLCSLRSLENFFGTDKVLFDDMTSAQLDRWIHSLRDKRNVKETYAIQVRRLFRDALREYNDDERGVKAIRFDPWAKVDIPRQDYAEKRAISAEECRAFFSVAPPSYKQRSEHVNIAEMGRDVAKMSLCLGGMNSVDLYNLLKVNCRDGLISYNRSKTKGKRRDSAYIEMRVEPMLLELFEKYKAGEDSPYLLNFHDRYVDSLSFNVAINCGIKMVCGELGMARSDSYTLYTFRHTWATVAQNDCGATIPEVAFALNHISGFSVTRGYIKPDFSPVWDLNRRVIDFIFFSAEQSKLAQRGKEVKSDFVLSSTMMVYARAYFRGEVMAEVSDIGFSAVDDVIGALAAKLPVTIPQGCAVQFRIKNLDRDCEAVYERTKGKGF